ncbi:MAG: amidohydrolase family protein [Colwellia sp.]
MNFHYKKVAKAICTVAAFTTVALANTVFAEDNNRFAIINAKVYTASDAGVLENATVVIEGKKIIGVHPEGEKSNPLTNMKVIVDAQGGILTPGFISSMNSLGLVEVGAVSSTRDGHDSKANYTLDSSLAFNPRSTLIAYSRKGGITSNVVSASAGEGLFAGQTFVADLSGNANSIVAKQNAVTIHLGAKSKGSRAKALHELEIALSDTSEELAKADKKEQSKKKQAEEKAKPTLKEQVKIDLLSGNKPLLAYANRASDILVLLALKEQFKFDLVLVGASDAVLIKDDIAKAKVPVLMSPINSLPGSFDSLHASLDNARVLNEAGIKVLFTPNGDAHNINQLRFDAGVAVANGFDYNEAIKAVTANVADVFNLNSGRIEVGKKANIVLWNNDPFELSSHVQTMWINGVPTSTRSRQDALRERYMSQSELPRSYSKIK